MPHILDLPDELLEWIAFDSSENLANMARTCKRMFKIAQKLLYTSIQLSSVYREPDPGITYRMCLLARTLVLRNDLAINVRCLSLTLINGDTLQDLDVEDPLWREAILRGQWLFSYVDQGDADPGASAASDTFFWVRTLFCWLPCLEHLTLEVVEKDYIQYSPYCSDRYAYDPLELIFGIPHKEHPVDPTQIAGFRNLRSLRLIVQNLEEEWFHLQQLGCLQIGLRCNVDMDDMNKDIVCKSKVSTVVIETDLFQCDGSRDVALSSFKRLKDLQIVELYFTNMDDPGGSLYASGPRPIDNVLSLTQSGLELLEGLKSLTIQPFHDDDPSYMEQIQSFDDLERFRLKSLTIPQGILLRAGSLPTTIETLTISEPTDKKIWPWLDKILRKRIDFPKLKTIVLSSRDSSLSSLPAWMKECREKGITLLLRETQPIRVLEGGVTRVWRTFQARPYAMYPVVCVEFPDDMVPISPPISWRMPTDPPSPQRWPFERRKRRLGPLSSDPATGERPPGFFRYEVYEPDPRNPGFSAGVPASAAAITTLLVLRRQRKGNSLVRVVGQARRHGLKDREEIQFLVQRTGRLFDLYVV
jgi:hypothetical protein